MVPTTLFCLPELRHRVDLLAQMLDQNGIAVTVKTKSSVQISDPTLLVYNEETLKSEWMQAVLERKSAGFRASNRVVCGS